MPLQRNRGVTGMSSRRNNRPIPSPVLGEFRSVEIQASTGTGIAVY
jgi:hypothetical protein